MGVYDLEPLEEAVSTGEAKKSSIIGRSSLEHSENDVARETVFEASPETAKENTHEKVLERANVQTVASADPQGVASNLSDDAHMVLSVDEVSRIEKLVAIALEKGPEQAFRVAVELDDMYALDMLHDKLSHQLHDELVSKGLLANE